MRRGCIYVDAVPPLSVIAGRVADLCSATLDAPVEVIVGECVLASGDNRPVNPRRAVHIPWRFEAQDAVIVVSQEYRALPPSVIEGLVRLVIEHVTVVEYLPNSDELKDRFIRDLLVRTEGVDEPEVRHTGQILGLDLTRPRSVIVVDAGAYVMKGAGAQRGFAPDRSRARASDVIHAIAEFFRLPSEAICGYLGDGRAAVLKACSTRDLQAWARAGADDVPASWTNLTAMKRAGQGLAHYLSREFESDVVVGVGRYHPGLDGLRASYEDCRLALALSRGGPPGAVRCLDELGVAALVAVADEATRRSLAERLLRPLNGEPDLLPTLRVFFEEDCHAKRAADRLAIHRNTLTYRLDKVAALTGLNPRNFQDSVQIQVAMVLHSHYGTSMHLHNGTLA